MTLLAERPRARAVATDVSEAALAVAQRNAEHHGVADRIEWATGDLFGAVERPAVRFDLLVSNPPYLAAEERPWLAPDVRDHEPAIALFGPGDDGLGLVRAIAEGASGHVRPGGAVVVEIGAGQGGAAVGIFERSGLERVVLHPDLGARDRVVVGLVPSR